MSKEASGHPPLLPGQSRLVGFGFREPAQYRGLRFSLDISPTGDHVWCPTNGDTSRIYSCDALVEHILSIALEEQQSHSRK